LHLSHESFASSVSLLSGVIYWPATKYQIHFTTLILLQESFFRFAFKLKVHMCLTERHDTKTQRGVEIDRILATDSWRHACTKAAGPLHASVSLYPRTYCVQAWWPPEMLWIRRRRARPLPGLKLLNHNYSYCYIYIQQTRAKLLTNAALTRRLSADQFAYTNFNISAEKMQPLWFHVNIYTPPFFFFFVQTDLDW